MLFFNYGNNIGAHKNYAEKIKRFDIFFSFVITTARKMLVPQERHMAVQLK